MGVTGICDNYTDINGKQYSLLEVTEIKKITATGVSSRNQSEADEFNLSQNYPNPFNSQTIIAYSLKEKLNVSLSVYDVLGNLVQKLVDEVKPAGHYTKMFDAHDLSSGAYFIKINAGNYTAAKKILYLK